MDECPHGGDHQFDDDDACANCHEPRHPTKAIAMSKDQREELYKRLDSEIRGSLLEFVRCGRALKEMRDSQAYIDHYGTFEEYVKAVEGMTIQYARENITLALVHDSLGETIASPRTVSQCRALAHAAIISEQKRTITGPSGKERTIKQPVAVKNPKQLRTIWQKVQSDYADQQQRDEKEGRPIRKLTASFIIDRLPNDKKPQHIIKRRESNACTNLIDAITAAVRIYERLNLEKEGRVESIANKEGWSDGLWAQLGDAITDCREVLDRLQAAVAGRV